MNSAVLLCFCVLSVAQQLEAATITFCEMLAELRQYGYEDFEVQPWLCLAEAVSKRTYNLVKQTPDGYSSYGIFLINERYWCTRRGEPGMGCKVNCKELLKRNLEKQIACANEIFLKRGFENWPEYEYVSCDEYYVDLAICPNLTRPSDSSHSGEPPVVYFEEDEETTLENKDVIHLTRCGLVEMLQRHNFPKYLLANWVCVLEYESELKYDAIGYNEDGSQSHGLFQINDAVWCTREGPPGGGCSIECAQLRVTDLTEAARCAKVIYQLNKFSAWSSFSKCNKNKTDISMCPPSVYAKMHERRLTRCGLVAQLRKHGCAESLWSDWVCIAEAESDLKYDLIMPNKDGSYSHGIFQINNKYWCTEEPPAGGDCHVLCRALRAADLEETIQCCMKIYESHKFTAWFSYGTRCTEDLKPNISHCTESNESD